MARMFLSKGDDEYTVEDVARLDIEEDFEPGDVDIVCPHCEETMIAGVIPESSGMYAFKCQFCGEVSHIGFSPFA